MNCKAPHKLPAHECHTQEIGYSSQSHSYSQVPRTISSDQTSRPIADIIPSRILSFLSQSTEKMPERGASSIRGRSLLSGGSNQSNGSKEFDSGSHSARLVFPWPPQFPIQSSWPQAGEECAAKKLCKAERSHSFHIIERESLGPHQRGHQGERSRRAM